MFLDFFLLEILLYPLGDVPRFLPSGDTLIFSKRCSRGVYLYIPFEEC